MTHFVETQEKLQQRIFEPTKTRSFSLIFKVACIPLPMGGGMIIQEGDMKNPTLISCNSMDFRIHMKPGYAKPLFRSVPTLSPTVWTLKWAHLKTETAKPPPPALGEFLRFQMAIARAVFVLSAAWFSSCHAKPPPNPCTAANCIPVFYPGLNGSHCYRIPSIIQTHKVISSKRAIH